MSSETTPRPRREQEQLSTIISEWPERRQQIITDRFPTDVIYENRPKHDRTATIGQFIRTSSAENTVTPGPNLENKSHEILLLDIHGSIKDEMGAYRTDAFDASATTSSILCNIQLRPVYRPRMQFIVSGLYALRASSIQVFLDKWWLLSLQLAVRFEYDMGSGVNEIVQSTTITDQSNLNVERNTCIGKQWFLLRLRWDSTLKRWQGTIQPDTSVPPHPIFNTPASNDVNNINEEYNRRQQLLQYYRRVLETPLPSPPAPNQLQPHYSNLDSTPTHHSITPHFNFHFDKQMIHIDRNTPRAFTPLILLVSLANAGVKAHVIMTVLITLVSAGVVAYFVAQE